jgi:hypothetical protein
MIARSYWHSFGLPVTVTRFANLFGGGDLNLSRLVPESAMAAIEGRRPVIRSDGTLERDYFYVEDAVEAYLAICDLLEGGKGAGEAFNARRAPFGAGSRRVDVQGRGNQRQAERPRNRDRSRANGSTRRSCARCPAGRRGSASRKGSSARLIGTANTSTRAARRPRPGVD